MLGICFCFFIPWILSAQSDLRPPAGAEGTVLNHYRDVVKAVLDTFQSDDWDEKIDYEVDDDVQVSSDRDVPLDINELTQRTYTVRNGSDLFQRDFAPIVEKLTATQDPNEMIALSKQLKMNRFSVEVHFNRANEGVKPAPASNPDLHIPGVAMAYRVNNYKFEKGTSVLLMFGDWKSATWQADNGWYHFRFQHRFRDPAIENIVVQLDGAPERINELLKTVNWKQLNDALTK
jgi:hypothetical protein